MKRQYYFMVAVAVLMIGLLTGCEHDNGELEKTEKAQLGVPLPDDFEAEEIMSRKKESEEVAAVEKTREDNNIIEENFDTKETKGRTLGQMQYDPKIMDYDPEDTIYYKTYYDDFVQGKIMNIDYYPHNEILDEMEDYFADDSEVFYLDNLISMFYDDRTIETDEKELEQLFWEHGYILYLHSVEFLDFHLRFIEIAEKEGLSLYPIQILMQTWDEDYIYLQDITGPIPRKIRDMMAVDKEGVWKLIVHSSGFSKEYISEEELSFWEFTGSYWILVPMELEIDTSHAFSLGNLYPDIDRNELFEAFYYRDGIAFRPSRQPDNEYGTNNTYRLGMMEITEENKSFRLVMICDVEGITRSSFSFIQFTIK